MNDIVTFDKDHLSKPKNTDLRLTQNPHQQIMDTLDISPDIQAILNLVEPLDLGKGIKPRIKLELYEFLMYRNKIDKKIPEVENISLEKFPSEFLGKQDPVLCQIGRVFNHRTSKFLYGHILPIKHSEYSVFIHIKNS